MKEQYVKPSILFESFSLTQTIAKDCGDMHDSTLGESNHYDPYSCQWIVGRNTDTPSVYFFVDACDDSAEIGDPEPGDDLDEVLEGMCYNNPDGGQMIFSST